MKVIITLLSCFILFFSSCKKEAATISCVNIQQGIVTGKNELLQKEINAICNSIPVQTSATDPNGLKHSLDELVNRISSLCGLSSSVICYFCIETLPEQAEIRVTVNTSSQVISKIIDISYKQNKQLIFVNMHE